MIHLKICPIIINIMPELPEVETVCNAINKNIRSKDIAKVNIINPNLRWKIDNKIIGYLENNRIKKIYRRAKYIIIEFSNGSLFIHLGMTGVIRLLKNKEVVSLKKHDHFDMVFKNGDILRYNDVRKFGSIHWAKDINKHFLLSNLGVEPLSEDLTIEYLYYKSKSKNVAIKNLIMNQNIVTGVGNIYASEALYYSGIRPSRKSHNLSKRNIKELIICIKNVLNEAIKAGGTTINDFKKVDGKPGYFKQKLAVYGQDVCKCGNKITNKKINGRSSYYCNICQQ